VIGRKQGCDLLLDDADVSREHAAIDELPDGRLKITDLHSRNGTFVNGQRISEPTVLSGDEELRVGTSVIGVLRDDAAGDRQRDETSGGAQRPESGADEAAPPGVQIFISYRHDDASGQAGRLADRLVARFGQDHVFMDIDNIAPGLDFRNVVQKAVNSCEIFLAVIGKHWVDATDSKGNRRIDNPDDYVRLEVDAALNRDVRVVPVLVEGAAMPTPDELPESLAPLSFRHAVALGSNFHSDVSDLITRLEKVEHAQTQASRRQVLDAEFADRGRRGGRGGRTAAPEVEDRDETPRTLSVHRKSVLYAFAALLLIVAAVGAAVGLHRNESPGAARSGRSLEGLVPFFGEWHCRKVTPPSAEIVEQAHCAPKAGADAVDLSLFSSSRAIHDTYAREVKNVRLVSPTKITINSGRCTKSDWGGEEVWMHAQGVLAGRKLCYLTSSGESYLVWTYNNTNLLVNSRRSDEAHGLLNLWFNSVAHDIGGSGAMSGAKM
jgi:hypothetical protein